MVAPGKDGTIQQGFRLANREQARKLARVARERYDGNVTACLRDLVEHAHDSLERRAVDGGRKAREEARRRVVAQIEASAASAAMTPEGDA